MLILASSPGFSTYSHDSVGARLVLMLIIALKKEQLHQYMYTYNKMHGIDFRDSTIYCLPESGLSSGL